jgi:precorrin-6B methylase 2
MKSNSAREAKKLFQLLANLLATSLRALKGFQADRQLLTDLYLKFQETQGKLPIKPAIEIFPQIDQAEFVILGGAHATISGGFETRLSLTTPIELCILAAITKAIAPNQIFEFGTAKGGTTCQFFLNTAANTQIYTLDKGASISKESAIQNAFRSNRVHAISADSTKFDFTKFNEQINLIFIDGGHDYETVKSDTRHALKILRPGGIIMWHDYKPDHCGVFNYLNELGTDLNLIHIQGTSFVAYQDKLIDHT